jgi:hypothetical protein
MPVCRCVYYLPPILYMFCYYDANNALLAHGYMSQIMNVTS